MGTERPLQGQELPGPALEAVARRRGEAGDGVGVGRVGCRPPGRVRPRVGPAGDQDRVGPGLVELGYGPVLEVQGLGVRAQGQPALAVGVQGGAGLLQGLADAGPGHQFAVEALHQQGRGPHMHRVGEGDDAPHPALQQGRGHGTEDGAVRDLGPAAGLQQHQGDLEPAQKIPQAAPGDQLGLAPGGLGALEAQDPDPGLREVLPVAVEVDYVVGAALPAGGGELPLQLGQGRGLAEVHLDPAGGLGQGVQDRAGAGAGVDEARVLRAADDEQDAQRQPELEGGLGLVARQPAAQRQAPQGQGAFGIAEHLPGADEEGGAVAGERQEAAAPGVEVVADGGVDPVVSAAGKERRPEVPAPAVQALLKGRGAGAVAGPGELDIALQVPGELVQVGLGEGQGQREGLAIAPVGLQVIAGARDLEGEFLGGWSGWGRWGPCGQGGGQTIEGGGVLALAQLQVGVGGQGPGQGDGAREQDRDDRLALATGQLQGQIDLVALDRAQAVGPKEYHHRGAGGEPGVHHRLPGPAQGDVPVVQPGVEAPVLHGLGDRVGQGGVPAVVTDEDLVLGHGGSLSGGRRGCYRIPPPGARFRGPHPETHRGGGGCRAPGLAETSAPWEIPSAAARRCIQAIIWSRSSSFVTPVLEALLPETRKAPAGPSDEIRAQPPPAMVFPTKVSADAAHAS